MRSSPKVREQTEWEMIELYKTMHNIAIEVYKIMHSAKKMDGDNVYFFLPLLQHYIL